MLPFSNLQMRVFNPDASAPLILPVHVVCNTPDETIHRNIRENSRLPNQWLVAQPAHDRVAIICGSGPSLADSVDEIRDLVGDIFALNGAAKYLFDMARTPDFQVILDPQPKTADLVGPAFTHLFASQVDPNCFARAPDATLWHLAIEGDLDELLPTDSHVGEPYTVIGAASSVGTTALVIAYALGYRTIHCYGLDSSHVGADTHAFRQPMNDGEPMCSVTFNGKDYRTSLTMKLQAERFPVVARQLVDCEIHVHGSGLLPDIWNAPVEQLSEQEKYERMWSFPAYRNEAPGEHCVAKFVEIAGPDHGDTVIDFGCGTGRASIELDRAGLAPRLVDFAANCRDVAAMHLPFYQLDLTEPMPIRADYGYCCDVMEHIPPADVDKVLTNIFNSVREGVFFQISTVPDAFGAVINQRLHLSVFPHDHWLSRLRELGRVFYACEKDEASIFYVVKP